MDELKRTGHGSYYNQAEQWPEEKLQESSLSSSAKKIDIKSGSPKKEKTSQWVQPGLSIVDGQQLQKRLERSACLQCTFGEQLLR